MTTTAPSSASPELIDDLITANRILAQQQILDGFGHMTVRDDSNPQQYLMSRTVMCQTRNAGRCRRIYTR
jgi:hypothetical protein